MNKLKKQSNKCHNQNPLEVKLKQQAFINLLQDWQEKVCKHKPQEVTIIFNNNECSMDIKI